MTGNAHMTRLWLVLAIVGALLAGRHARAAEADVYCQTGTSSTGAPIFLAASSTNPCPVTGTPSGTQAVNLIQTNGATQLTGAGATGAGSERVTAAQDTTTIAGSAPGTAGTPSANVVSVQGVSGGTTLPTNLTAATSGGCVPYHLSGGTAASNNSTSIKGSAGNLCGLSVFNDGTGSATTVNYLKVYDSASAPTCSSATNLKHVYPIPVSATVAGFIWSLALNESYANGIGFCVVSTGADTGNGNAQTGIYVEASYK